MTFRTLISSAAAGLALVAPVAAHGIAPLVIEDRAIYSGSWPVTVSKAARGDGTYCLILKETQRNAGSASLTGNGTNQPFGTFFIVNHLLVATIQQPGGYSDAGLVFIGPANNGNIGNGVFEQVYGGENSDSGHLSFGMKGGC
jgi:hypothetical protein